ncbi:MAG: tRNA threonylcarbamoyladenosine dehydratase [Clostridia bacterium]|nr:tRNA threonylcarbamoyladenosine dehydratase [Clostridia bacterium]
MLGTDSINILNNAKILLFGLGGVGGYIAESLARSGIGTIGIVDNDTVNESNLNRQIIATTETIGMNKTDAVKERILKINPDCNVISYNLFFTPETDEIPFSDYDYVIDAIDTVTSKIEIAKRCHELNIPLISSMGTGNKIHPELLEIADITKTSVCPLARVMRRELKARGIPHLKVVYSKEEPFGTHIEENGRRAPGSCTFVPAAAGIIIASEVVRNLLNSK